MRSHRRPSQTAHRRGNLRPASTTTRARRARADETRCFIRRLILLSSTKSSSSLSSLSSSLSLSCPDRLYPGGHRPGKHGKVTEFESDRGNVGKVERSQKMFFLVVCYGVSVCHVMDTT